ncbi:MAG: hypothetical protein EHM57_00850, partial [Actinobacteria bacterium]
MAEHRIRAVSLVLWMVLVAVGAYFAAAAAMEAGDPGYRSVLAATLVWGAAIACCHLLSVPTPSGARVNLGIGPAVAAAILLDDPNQLAAAYAIGMAAAWVARRATGRFDARTESGFLNEALSMAVFGVLATLVMGVLADTALAEPW